MTIERFIVDTVLPNASTTIQAQRTDAGVQATAKCHATEQVVCGAMKENLISMTALNTTFKINGTGDQVVSLADRPPPPPPP